MTTQELELRAKDNKEQIHREVYNVQPGERYGSWTVVEFDESSIAKNRKNKKWISRCDCGTVRSVVGHLMANGVSKSCGCKIKKYSSIGEETTGNKLYHVYKAMIDRCENTKNKQYHRYGGRGISVCSEWKKSYINFSKWARGNGYREGLTIDRINKNRGYCPENCEWVTRQENCRRQAKFIVYKSSVDGLLMDLWQMADEIRSGLWPDIYDAKSPGEWCMGLALDWFKSHDIEVQDDINRTTDKSN